MLALAALCLLQPAEEWRVTWFPDRPLVRHALADPRAPHTGTRFQFPVHREDDLKVENVLGAEVPVIRLEVGGHSFEFGAEAAAFSRFDVSLNWDMDGVDYRFGFPLTYRRGPLALKVHPWHVTSHLGDEFIERTGRERLVYSRNELAFGFALGPDRGWRVTGEVGWAFVFGDVNDPWRWQAGIEHVSRLWDSETVDLYAAANFTSYQELDWEGPLALQAGAWIRPAGARLSFRVGLEYMRGHSPLTQFFLEHEEYWSFGVWFHL